MTPMTETEQSILALRTETRQLGAQIDDLAAQRDALQARIDTLCDRREELRLRVERWASDGFY